jgi:hypothetical protein
MTTETELFAAYRNSVGYSAPCICGGVIEAVIADDVPEAVDVHNQSPQHQQWRAEVEAVEALRRKPVHVCSCHDGDA